jgi:hypothetical protein
MPKINKFIVYVLAPLVAVALYIAFRTPPNYARPVSLFFPRFVPPPPPPPWKETFIPIRDANGKSSKNDIDVSSDKGEIEVVEVIHKSGKYRKFDIVFILDNSGSMLGHAEGIKKSLNSACDKFSKSGADIQLAGVHFGSSEDVCYPTKADNFKLFRDWLNADGATSSMGVLSRSRFGNGDAIAAIPRSLFRRDAQIVFITIGDDDNHTGNTGGARDSLELNRDFPKALWFSITTEGNLARSVSKDLKGIHIELPADSNLSLDRINFVHLVTSETVAKIRHRLPKGQQKVNISSDAGLFPPQQTTISVP